MTLNHPDEGRYHSTVEGVLLGNWNKLKNKESIRKKKLEEIFSLLKKKIPPLFFLLNYQGFFVGCSNAGGSNAALNFSLNVIQ